MKALLAYDLPGLEAELAALGMPKYRARQVFAWVYHKLETDFSAMTDLGQADRTRLAEHFGAVIPPDRAWIRAADGVGKLGLPLADGALVEAVAIPEAAEESPGMTFCLSSQTGCAVGCTFCRTGSIGAGRNLGTHEILAQVVALAKLVKARPEHIVFMGMGEPLLNRDAVSGAVQRLTEKSGLGLATRRITVSTVGIPDGIRAMIDWPGEVNLAVSLHAAADDLRTRLVPINRKIGLERLRGAVTEYLAATNRRVTFEVVLIAGVNDGEQDALNVAGFCEGLLCHVNLIPLNPVAGSGMRTPGEATVKAFRKVLKKAGVNATVRQSRGGGISAACGQLAGAGDGSFAPPGN